MKKVGGIIFFSSILFIIFIGILLTILYKTILKYKIITLIPTLSTPGTSQDVSENENTLNFVIKDPSITDISTNTDIKTPVRDFNRPIPIDIIIAPDGSMRQAPLEYQSPQPFFTNGQELFLSLLIDPMTILGLLNSKIVKSTLTIARNFFGRAGKSFIRFLFGRATSMILLDMGMIAGRKAATVFGNMLATRVGTRLSTLGAGILGTGPAAPVVLLVELGFAALSIGLDFGDAGGYVDMRTNNTLLDMKKEFDKMFDKHLETSKAPPKNIKPYEIPIIIGPDFDEFFLKKSEEERESFITQGYRELFLRQHPLIQPVINKINQDIVNLGLTITQIKRDNSYIDGIVGEFLSEEQQLNCMKEFADIYCQENGGKVIKRPDRHVCSWINKEICDKKSPWPRQQHTKEILPKISYTEYKSSAAGGKGACLLASPNMRLVCDQAKLDYNTENGLCTVTEYYCKMKGSQWKNGDCYISDGQWAAEMIFGTTIVRGWHQLFDADQYETCKAPEYETPGNIYFCNSKGCNDGDEDYAGTCYPKCPPGTVNSGCCLCAAHVMGIPPAKAKTNCENGYSISSIGMCRENNCAPGEWKTSPGFCEGPCPEGWYTSSPGFCTEKCKPGETPGVVPGWCNRPCPDGYEDIASVCWPKIFFKKHYSREWGKGCCCTIWGCCDQCPNDSEHWESNCFCGKHNCDKGWSDKWGKGGLLNHCYEDCPAGWHDDGISCRMLKDEFTVTRLYMAAVKPSVRSLVSKPASCNPGEYNVGDFCYQNCESGYSSSSLGFCRKDGVDILKGRGVGYPYNRSRPKNRSIEWSTKEKAKKENADPEIERELTQEELDDLMVDAGFYTGLK
jgi:hypothetical protein